MATEPRRGEPTGANRRHTVFVKQVGKLGRDARLFIAQRNAQAQFVNHCRGFVTTDRVRLLQQFNEGCSTERAEHATRVDRASHLCKQVLVLARGPPTKLRIPQVNPVSRVKIDGMALCQRFAQLDALPSDMLIQRDVGLRATPPDRCTYIRRIRPIHPSPLHAQVLDLFQYL